jgi:hypothetical protein
MVVLQYYCCFIVSYCQALIIGEGSSRSSNCCYRLRILYATSNVHSSVSTVMTCLGCSRSIVITFATSFACRFIILAENPNTALLNHLHNSLPTASTCSSNGYDSQSPSVLNWPYFTVKSGILLSSLSRLMTSRSKM